MRRQERREEGAQVGEISKVFQLFAFKKTKQNLRVIKKKDSQKSEQKREPHYVMRGPSFSIKMRGNPAFCGAVCSPIA